METTIIAERLRGLRNRAGLTQEELVKELYEKQKVTITTETIKKYETSNSKKLGQICGMRIEYLNAFADFYGVSTDYILGRTKSESKNLNKRLIYDNYGLSTSSLENLSKLVKKEKIMKEKVSEELPDYDIHNIDDFLEVNPVYIFDFMLSDWDFVNHFSNDILWYCQVRFEKGGIYTDNQPDPKKMFSIGTFKYVVLNHLDWIVEKYYNSFVKGYEKLNSGKDKNNATKKE